MAATAVEGDSCRRDDLNPAQLHNSKKLSVNITSPSGDAAQSKEIDEQPVKVRKPYTITKQREKWTEEEHEKFLEALKLYGRSWRQIQEHIGTKTAVQIRSHAQKFFSKVSREPGAESAIEIPPPRPKRKPLHPYPRKCGSSPAAVNAKIEQSKFTARASSSASDQENRSPVSVLSALQSDAFGSSVSNPSTGCASPASSDDGEDVPALVAEQEAEDENATTQHRQASSRVTTEDDSRTEPDQDCKDDDLSEEGSSMEAQETSLKLFGKTVVIPDPRKVCSSNSAAAGSDSCPGNGEHSLQSSNEEIIRSSPVRGISADTASKGWSLAHSSLPFHFHEPMDAETVPLHLWWPFYGIHGIPLTNPSGVHSLSWMEATDESDTAKSSSVRPSLDSEGNARPSTENVSIVESFRKIQSLQSVPSFELKPSKNSAFVRVADESNTAKSSSLRPSLDSEGNARSSPENLSIVGSLRKIQSRQSVPAFELKPSENSAFVRVKPIRDMPARGFVPYKRCKIEQ